MSLNNTTGNIARLPQAVAGYRAANAGEHSATTSLLEDQADNILPILGAGLHVIFDSARDGQSPRVAEIEYVPPCPAVDLADRPFY
jgi:hypothetical protein